MNPDSQSVGSAALPQPLALQATLFDFAIGELVRQHRDSFAPLWTVESWAKLMIWLALNCGSGSDPAALEGFAAALGPRLTSRMRRLYFTRERQELNLQVMADPAEQQLLVLPLDGLCPLPPSGPVIAVLEDLGLAPLLVDDQALWIWQPTLVAVPWRQQPGGAERPA